MKNFLIIFFIISTIISFGLSLENYIYEFDSTNYINSEDIKSQIFGGFLKFLETNQISYRDSARKLYYESKHMFDDKTIKIYDIFSRIISNEQFFMPSNEFEKLLIEYPNSIIINAMYIKFAYGQWSNDGLPITGKKMLECIEYLENEKGLNPFSTFYYSKIKWNSKVFGNPEKAYQKIIKTNDIFPKNLTILELLINYTYQKNDFDYLNKLYKSYTTFENKNPFIYLMFIESYINQNNYDKAYYLLKWNINNTNSNNILAKSYEYLGDISQNFFEKKIFYEKALELDYENKTLLAKYGSTLYKLDPKENLIAARLALNRAYINGYLAPEFEKILNEIRVKVMFNTIIKFVVPVIIVIVISIIFIIKWDSKQKFKERELVKKEFLNL